MTNRQSISSEASKTDERSETIPKGSRPLKVETGNTLTCNDAGKDIVQNKIKERLKHFISISNKKFNNKFNYSKFLYFNVKTKGIIICPIHGEFLQTPDKHTDSEHGCSKCSIIERSKKLSIIKQGKEIPKRQISKKKFLELANNKYNNKFTYDLSNYNGITKNNIIVICNKHGQFSIKPSSHLCNNTKHGCMKCGQEKFSEFKTKSYDSLVKELNNLYENKYSYPEINRIDFKNRKSIIEIICPKHGKFKKSAQKHLVGQCCFKCTINELIKNNILTGGYCEQLFNLKPLIKTKKSYLYYLSINNGEYFKIGITATKIKYRLRGIKAKAKSVGYKINNIEIIKIKEYNLYNSYLLEQEILNLYVKHRQFTSWSNELFNIDIQNNLSKYFKSIYIPI